MQFSMVFEMEDTAWITPDTCGQAKATIAETFCSPDLLDCAGNGLKLTVTALKTGGTDACAGGRRMSSRKLQNGGLEVDFEAEATGSGAAATASLNAAVAAVEEVQEMDTSQMATLATTLSQDLSEALDVEVTVQGVKVTKAAAIQTVAKAVPTQPPAEEEGGGGLGGGAIAGIVIAAVVVLGGGGFFMMKKGGGGDRA